MPHQCIRCNKVYEDQAREILVGCPCGCKLFFFVKKEIEPITEEVQEKLEKEIIKDEKPVSINVESVKILNQGKYELDIEKIFNEKTIITKHKEGKYSIELPYTIPDYNLD